MHGIGARALRQDAQNVKDTWVLDGANADHCLDYRSGMKAVAELEWFAVHA